MNTSGYPQKKYLYHQIHPTKLLTDGLAGVISLYYFWHHQLLAALAVALIPSVIVSALLLKFANLEKQRASRFGQYVQRYMSRAMEIQRLVGCIIMALGSWHHAPWIIAAGASIILFAWLNGILR